MYNLPVQTWQQHSAVLQLVATLLWLQAELYCCRCEIPEFLSSKRLLIASLKSPSSAHLGRRWTASGPRTLGWRTQPSSSVLSSCRSDAIAYLTSHHVAATTYACKWHVAYAGPHTCTFVMQTAYRQCQQDSSLASLLSGLWISCLRQCLQCSEQIALEGQDLPRMYIAHHELESRILVIT